MTKPVVKIGQSAARDVAVRASQIVGDGETPGAALAERDAPLTPSEEEFARKLVLYRNATRAFSETYDCSNMKRETVWAHACRHKYKPNVQRRVQEIEAAAASALHIDAQWLLASDLAVVQAAAASADLSWFVWKCCRHCHGINHGYQWIDATEYAMACAAVMEQNVERAEKKQKLAKLPSDAGGYGYSAQAMPHTECPSCAGLGVQQAVVADTRTLEGNAALLFRGVKQTTAGVEVITADVEKARDRLYRSLGLYGDDAASVARAAAAGSAAGAAAGRARASIDENMTAEQAARVYLELSQ